MNKRILIVEDDASIWENLAHMLEMQHHEVGLAQTSHRAVSKLLLDLPDLVLLDLDMRKEDGWYAFELMAKVRPFVPTIVITEQRDHFLHACKRGVDALIEKPLNLPFLLGAVTDRLAEPQAKRLARLTSGTFQTRFLGADSTGETHDGE